MKFNMPISPLLRIFSTLIFLSLLSCNKDFKKDDYRAYFGGEVLNPTNRFIYFSKDGVVIDTIPLQKDNTFFVQFDSLAPGMYTFKHDPEYQYVFFDKKNKLVVSLDTYTQGNHFIDFKQPQLVIKKIIRSSISDLICKGINPKYYFISGSGNKKSFSKLNLSKISKLF